jgi:hypothetical protein
VIAITLPVPDKPGPAAAWRRAPRDPPGPPLLQKRRLDPGVRPGRTPR